jgi:Ca-activated chloride channel family protein
VLNSIKKTWRQDRKPANVELVLDVSGSMSQENRLARAQQGLEAFFREVSPNDRVGLTIFSDQIQRLVPIALFSKNRDRLRSIVRQLVADGGTAVYNATAQSLETVRALHDRKRINAVVVLTDGEDTDSTLSAQDVINRARAQGDSREQVRVFTIAYSAQAEGARQALTGIAKASGGQDYEGSTEDIETVYRSISSFF